MYSCSSISSWYTICIINIILFIILGDYPVTDAIYKSNSSSEFSHWSTLTHSCASYKLIVKHILILINVSPVVWSISSCILKWPDILNKYASY